MNLSDILQDAPPHQPMGPYFSSGAHSGKVATELFMAVQHSLVIATHAFDWSLFKTEEAGDKMTRFLLEKGRIVLLTDATVMPEPTDSPLIERLQRYTAHPDYRSQITLAQAGLAHHQQYTF